MDRKAKLKLAIQAIEHRRRQLINLLDSMDCVLCQAHFGCKECPAHKGKGLVYSCQSFALDVGRIEGSLRTQRMEFERMLEEEG